MESNFDIHNWQAKHLTKLIKENTIQESEGYIEVMGPDFDQAIELLQSAWEEWKNGPATEPEDIPDGFIWVDADSTVPIVENPIWQLKASGSLTGPSVSVSGIAGEKFFVVLRDWSHSNTDEVVGLVVRFNSDLGPNYVNTGGLISASSLVSPEFSNTATHDLTIKVDLANTAAMLKPVETIADTNSGSYFGYYKNTNQITSIQISLSDSGNFDAGSYQVWSYE